VKPFFTSSSRAAPKNRERGAAKMPLPGEKNKTAKRQCGENGAAKVPAERETHAGWEVTMHHNLVMFARCRVNEKKHHFFFVFGTVFYITLSNLPSVSVYWGRCRAEDAEEDKAVATAAFCEAGVKAGSKSVSNSWAVSKNTLPTLFETGT